MGNKPIQKKAVILTILFVGTLLLSVLSVLLIPNNEPTMSETIESLSFNLDESKNGFHIYQFIDDTWEERYQTNFPISYDTQSFPIHSISDQLKITILHTGSHFADIEQITLTTGETQITPLKAIRTQTQENILSDILKNDYNVVVAHEQPLEITWDLSHVNPDDLTLTIRANEYGWFGRPFLFSDGIYQLGSTYQPIMVDGILEKTLGSPTHQVLWEPASGHPNGYTYIYVTEDEHHLYFSFDITCDNSNEFGDDWAEICINNQIYRIDDFHTQWGKLGFGYTEKVSYKHQMAEFCIPKPKTSEEVIEFTFRYYGTAITEDGSIIDIDLGEQTIYPSDQMAVQNVQVKDHGADGGALSIDYFTIFNDGTASNSQIARISLWRDHGDGEFDGGQGDDTLVGQPVINPDLTTGVAIGGKGDGNIVNIANGLSYYFWIVVDLDQDAEEHGNTIQTKINGTLSPTSYSNWKPYWKSGFELATSETTIDASPTGTLSIDTDPVSENDLDFTISIVYDEPMDTSVIPSMQFVGQTGGITMIAGSWATAFRYDRTYSIADVDEGSLVTVESSGAKDLSGNTEGPCTPTNFTVDTAQPTISDITGDTTGTTGEKTTIEATFSDNIEVDTAIIFYRIQGGTWKTKSISSGEIDISIPADTIKTWEYYLEVKDTASNSKKDSVPPTFYEITVSDNDAPILSDNSPSSCVAGQSYTFYASSIDNIDETPFVYVEYWFDEGSHIDKSMVPATGNYYQYQITIPTSAETFSYIISSKDSSDNWEQKSTKTLTVDSEADDDPSLIHPISDPNGPYYDIIDVPISFDGSGSSDADGTISNFSWTFGDGTQGYGINPTHTYSTGGIYTITLLVTDNDGLTHLNATMATISDAIDTDNDGYSDEMEESYQTNKTDNQSYPIDTDNDGIADIASADEKFEGDTDDDNDGVFDQVESTFGSDPKNDEDVNWFDEINGYLIDTDNDGIPDIYYNAENQTDTTIEPINDETLGVDIDGDEVIDYTYDTGTNEIETYTEPDTEEDSFPILIVGAIIIVAIIAIIGGYIYQKKR